MLANDERSLPELTKDLAGGLGDLVRNELRLARAEASANLRKIAADTVRVVLGASLAGAAVTLALFALAYALAEAMPMWGAALIAAALGAIVAYWLIKSGSKALANESIGLPRTTKSVSEDIQSVKEQITS